MILSLILTMKFKDATQQGSKLTLANSQNASDFDNLRVRKISPSKRLRVRIIHVSQTKGNNLLVVSPVCQRKKILLAKLCKCTKKITSSPAHKIFFFRQSQTKKRETEFATRFLCWFRSIALLSVELFASKLASDVSSFKSTISRLLSSTPLSQFF